MTEIYSYLTEEREKELFDKTHQLIMDRKLFLDPKFSRETYLKLVGLNKNQVAKLLQKYAGTNLIRYINGMRLDYSLKLMEMHPEYPIKAISADSGFNNTRTFYRLFSARFGIAPSEYKRKS